ncbi:MAG: hypothetical protein R3A79_30880 [Nannocystaceae bacterium]
MWPRRSVATWSAALLACALACGPRPQQPAAEAAATPTSAAPEVGAEAPVADTQAQADAAPACDAAILEAAAAEVQAAEEAWSPRDGRPPELLTAAVSGIWRACPALSPELRAYLDLLVPHPQSAAELDGRPRPRDPDDPLAARLPGHGDVHDDSLGPRRGIHALRETICDFDQVLAASGDAGGPRARSAAIYDGCKLDRLSLVNRDEYIERAADAVGVTGAALFRWLVDAGAPTAAARVLGRALVLADAFAPARALQPEQRLPHAPDSAGHPLGYGLEIQLGDAGLIVDGRRLARLGDRGLDDEGLAALAEHLSDLPGSPDRGDWRRDLLLLADPSLPWAAIEAVILAADARAPLDRVDVAALVPDVHRPLAAVALHGGEPGPSRLDLTTAAWRLTCPSPAGDDADGFTAEVLPGDDLSAALTGCTAGGGVVLEIAEDVALQAVVDAAAALRARPRTLEILGGRR